MCQYRIASGSTHDLSDTEDFIELLDSFDGILPESGGEFFCAGREVWVARAPGRLDVMGGIADYSGSLVLQLPIAAAAHVAVQRNGNRNLRIISVPSSSAGTQRSFGIQLDELLRSGIPADYSIVRQVFANDPASHWAAYVVGAFVVLMREKSCEFAEGANILIRSAVPEGKGVSSSAALEVASMAAVISAYDLEITGKELALLCQKVENLVAGAPCGVMDQMTAACGEVDRLLELLCRPCDLKGTLAVPDELELWGLDSGIRHFVGGSDYTTVRTAAFMGYRIIADIAGLNVSSQSSNKVCVDDQRWHGHLANITPTEFEREFSASLPGQMNGKEFLDRYSGITDLVTEVRPDVVYPVWQATRHPIYENHRVSLFATILRSWKGKEEANTLGELMFQSHGSYSDCGLGTPETDLLVSFVREAIAEACEAWNSAGLYGARITGGGSGGTVAVLGDRGNLDVIEKLAARYHRQTGHRSTIISGSSPGAATFGKLRLVRT
jgi:galactokinase